jgi:hypothetical protein
VGQALPLLLRFSRAADLLLLLLAELSARSAAGYARLRAEKDRADTLSQQVEALKGSWEREARAREVLDRSARALRQENLELSEALKLAAQDFAAAGLSVGGAEGVVAEEVGARAGGGGGGAARAPPAAGSPPASAKKRAAGSGRVVVVPRSGGAPAAPSPALPQGDDEGYVSAESGGN